MQSIQTEFALRLHRYLGKGSVADIARLKRKALAIVDVDFSFSSTSTTAVAEVAKDCLSVFPQVDLMFKLSGLSASYSFVKFGLKPLYFNVTVDSCT
jgi:hypothetical protein